MCLRHTAGECDGASVAPTSVHATVSHRCRWWNVSIHTEKTPYRHAQDAIPHAVDRALVGGCCCQYGPTS